MFANNENNMQTIGTREDRGRKIAEMGNQVTRIDEHSYKVRSQTSKVVYNVISTEIGCKYKHDAQSLFHEGKELMGRRPNTLITDGLAAYHDAFNREFFTITNPRSKHINSIKLNGDMNNNKMERINGEIRDREKVMRGLKKKSTPILKGYQIYHNYIRPHESLKGKTPAEACGITVEGGNKWITLIQNASKKTEC
jgi:transposase-like protein